MLPDLKMRELVSKRLKDPLLVNRDFRHVDVSGGHLKMGEALLRKGANLMSFGEQANRHLFVTIAAGCGPFGMLAFV